MVGVAKANLTAFGAWLRNGNCPRPLQGMQSSLLMFFPNASGDGRW
jgi:hypothetical protein